MFNSPTLCPHSLLQMMRYNGNGRRFLVHMPFTGTYSTKNEYLSVKEAANAVFDALQADFPGKGIPTLLSLLDIEPFFVTVCNQRYVKEPAGRVLPKSPKFYYKTVKDHKGNKCMSLYEETLSGPPTTAEFTLVEVKDVHYGS